MRGLRLRKEQNRKDSLRKQNKEKKRGLKSCRCVRKNARHFRRNVSSHCTQSKNREPVGTLLFDLTRVGLQPTKKPKHIIKPGTRKPRHNKKMKKIKNQKIKKIKKIRKSRKQKKIKNQKSKNQKSVKGAVRHEPLNNNYVDCRRAGARSRRKSGACCRACCAAGPAVLGCRGGGVG